jgi:hypothetical protein
MPSCGYLAHINQVFGMLLDSFNTCSSQLLSVLFLTQGGIDGREAAGSTPGSARRNSLAGMFPFLQKQQSMDTGAQA